LQNESLRSFPAAIVQLSEKKTSYFIQNIDFYTKLLFDTLSYIATASLRPPRCYGDRSKLNGSNKVCIKKRYLGKIQVYIPRNRTMPCAPVRHASFVNLLSEAQTAMPNHDKSTQTDAEARNSDTLAHCMLNYYTDRYHSQGAKIDSLRSCIAARDRDVLHLSNAMQEQRDAFDFLALNHDMLIGMYNDLRQWAAVAIEVSGPEVGGLIASRLRELEGLPHPIGTMLNPIDLTANEDL